MDTEIKKNEDGEIVRVLTMGEALETPSHYSMEFCGGTHVARTGDIAFGNQAISNKAMGDAILKAM